MAILPGRKIRDRAKPVLASETSVMINDLKVIFETEISGLKQKCKKDEFLTADMKRAFELTKVLLLVQKEERAEKAVDDIDSLSDEELEEIMKETNKRIKSESKSGNKEIIDDDSESTD